MSVQWYMYIYIYREKGLHTTRRGKVCAIYYSPFILQQRNIVFHFFFFALRWLTRNRKQKTHHWDRNRLILILILHHHQHHHHHYHHQPYLSIHIIVILIAIVVASYVKAHHLTIQMILWRTQSFATYISYMIIMLVCNLPPIVQKILVFCGPCLAIPIDILSIR